MEKVWKSLIVFAGRVTRFASKRLSLALAIIAASFALIASLIYLWSQDKAEDVLIEQVLFREQVVARAGAKSIESFVELTGNTLVVFATRPAIVSWGENTQEVLDKIVKEWSGTPLVEVGLIDSEGKVRYLSNLQKVPLEESMTLVERDYFLSLKGVESGKVFIGKPILAKLGAYQGQYILPVATSIYEGEKFKGIVGAAISLSQLTETYLQPLSIFPNTQIFLIDEGGLFLYSPYPGTLGKNIFEWVEESSVPEKEKVVELIKKQLSSPGEAKFDLVWPDLTNASHLKRYLVASSSVQTGERKLILGVATPIDEMKLFYAPFKLSTTTAFIVSILIIISLSMLTILVIRIVQKDAYLDGFVDGRDHVVNKGKGTSS